jgi:hypothetical protein
MRTFLSLLILAFSTVALGQAPAPKVAALSLIGDRLQVVSAQMQTGSRIDRNRKESVALQTDELDTATVLGFERVAKAARPGLGIILLRANDRSVHELQDAVLAGKRDIKDLLAAVAPLARRAGATHLVLFAKHRGEAQIQIGDGSVGTGYIDGLGFYVDRWERQRRTDTGTQDAGLLAPFAYFQALLVELDSLKVVAQESSHQARALLPGARVMDLTDPWNYLTPAEKVETLKALSAEGLERLVPKILQKLG